MLKFQNDTLKEKLQKEITALKRELKLSKEQSVPTNDKQVTANKKQNTVIAGDSVINSTEDQYNLNTKKANVSIRAFPGSTIEDFKDYITPLARKKPDALITHMGTNNVRNDTPSQITEKLIQLYKYLKSVSPETKVVSSNIMRRKDYQKEHFALQFVDQSLLKNCQ